MTKKMLMSNHNTVWICSWNPLYTGHSLRIGGTTHYLNKGVPPNVVKSLGRYRSQTPS
ncbi:hypothetical protein J3R30DRAFT_3530312 [Lentinula aciculospora]|uniref:Uncharacterized protein n=1 Tax=Lentinula aciculospora TaxID=153920 RepID=A0A9W9A0K8_9AGAR|nr:hypothetical protein J3R30DRAFT_3530312 [Lentinula aciculospora]